MREERKTLAGLRVVQREVRVAVAIVRDDRYSLAVRRRRRAVKPRHVVDAGGRLHQSVDQHFLCAAAGVLHDDVREAELRRDHLSVDRALPVDLLDPREDDGAAVGRDARLVGPALGGERHVSAARENVHVAADREGDRAVHARTGHLHPLDRLRRSGGRARTGRERRRDPRGDREVHDDQHDRDRAEGDLARADHRVAASTAATTASIPPVSSVPFTSSRKPSVGGSKGCARIRS